MNDLISRKALIRKLFYAENGSKYPTRDCDNFHITISLEDLRKVIRDIPAAYDVVVEQLEEARDELLHSTDYNNDIINYCLDWFDMAIEIVKGAVKDE